MAHTKLMENQGLTDWFPVRFRLSVTNFQNSAATPNPVLRSLCPPAQASPPWAECLRRDCLSSSQGVNGERGFLAPIFLYTTTEKEHCNLPNVSLTLLFPNQAKREVE